MENDTTTIVRFLDGEKRERGEGQHARSVQLLGGKTCSVSLPPCHLLTRTNDSSRFIASLDTDVFKHRRKVRAQIAEY